MEFDIKTGFINRLSEIAMAHESPQLIADFGRLRQVYDSLQNGMTLVVFSRPESTRLTCVVCSGMPSIYELLG